MCSSDLFPSHDTTNELLGKQIQILVDREKIKLLSSKIAQEQINLEIAKNGEGLVALGMVLPLPLGIVVLMLKPQIGLALTAYYVLSAYVHDGWKRAALILVPVLVLFTVSFFLYGAWFLKPLEVIERTYNTIYFFPIGVPVGVALIVAGAAIS